MTRPKNKESTAAERTSVPAWVVFGFLVLAEYLVVSYSIDAQDVLAPAHLESLLGHVGNIVPLAFIFVAAVFLVGGEKVRRRLRNLSLYRERRIWTAVSGVSHVLVYAASLALALWLASRAATPVHLARVSLAVWFGSILASLFTLVLSLWSPRMLLDAVQGLRRELTVGLVIGIAAWATGLLSQQLWKPLAWLTLESVHALLSVLASDPVASIENSLVGTSRFYVEVAPVCSGIEGMGLMVVFIGAYLYSQRAGLSWPRSLILLPLSALLAWVLNVVRVTALVAVGTWISPDVALGGFHSKAGWVFFALTALLTVHLVENGRTFRLAGASSPGTDPSRGPPPIPNESVLKDAIALPLTGTPPTVQAETSVPSDRDMGVVTAAFLAPMLAVIAVKLVTGLATSDFDYFYPLTVAAAALALYRFRAHYPPLSLGAPLVPLGVGLAVALLWILGFQRGDATSQLGEGLSRLSPALAALWLAARAFGTIVTIPIVEELAFRGYLLRRFSSADFDTLPYGRFSWLGLVLSSVAFGLLHSQWELGILAGLVFGTLTIVRGRLSDAIVAHATANAAIMSYVLTTQDWLLLG